MARENSEGAEIAQFDRSLTTSINVYYDVYLPDTLPAPLLIGLHGYGASKRQMLREGRQMAPENFAIASLQGFHQHLKDPKEAGGPLRFGFGWLTNFRPEESIVLHHRALLDLIERLIGEGIAESQRIFLLGFSQSCALNYRYAFTYPDGLRGVVGICGGLPGDWATSEKYQPSPINVFHLAGSQDEFYTPARVSDYAERLRTRAANVTFKSYDAGHEITPLMREDVRRWLECLTQ
jgi:phospholipase/carboxylesterase